MFQHVRPLVLALMPLVFALLAAFGISLSEDVKAMIVENVTAILVALGALGTVVPGIVAALRQSRDEDAP